MNKALEHAWRLVVLPSGLLIVGAMVQFSFVESAKAIGGNIASDTAQDVDPYIEAAQHADQAVRDSNELNRCTDKGYSASYCMEQQQLKKSLAPGGALNEALSAAQKITDANVLSLPVPPIKTGVDAESELDGTVKLIINVSGRTNPWDQSANPQMIYAAPNEAFAPRSLALSKTNIAPGERITLKCTGGSTNAGGLPDSGCDGLTQFEPANDRFQPACNTYYPSKFADKSTYPIYAMQILAAFATDSGAVVGEPFLVSSKSFSTLVPVGATRLQFGMNDCKNSDNAPSPLVVEIDLPAMSKTPQRPTQTAVPATGPSFDCDKASSNVEKLICSTPELAKADAEMAIFYKKNMAVSGADSAAIKQGQRAFISIRNQCSTVSCVSEAYRARYEELGQLGYIRE